MRASLTLNYASNCFPDFRTLKSMVQMADGVTCMAFTVSFVPNTGNKYFLAAADENLRLYDFEHATVSSSSFWSLFFNILEIKRSIH